jgi:hypothetical protein
VRGRRAIHVADPDFCLFPDPACHLDPASADVVVLNCRDDGAQPDHDPDLFR